MLSDVSSCLWLKKESGSPGSRGPVYYRSTGSGSRTFLPFNTNSPVLLVKISYPSKILSSLFQIFSLGSETCISLSYFVAFLAISLGYNFLWCVPSAWSHWLAMFSVSELSVSRRGRTTGATGASPGCTRASGRTTWALCWRGPPSTTSIGTTPTAPPPTLARLR